MIMKLKEEVRVHGGCRASEKTKRLIAELGDNEYLGITASIWPNVQTPLEDICV
jgi:hypothetical protein